MAREGENPDGGSRLLFELGNASNSFRISRLLVLIAAMWVQILSNSWSATLRGFRGRPPRRPFAAARAFPAALVGPVLNRQGWRSKIDSRTRCRPPALSLDIDVSTTLDRAGLVRFPQLLFSGAHKRDLLRSCGHVLLGYDLIYDRRTSAT